MRICPRSNVTCCVTRRVLNRRDKRTLPKRLPVAQRRQVIRIIYICIIIIIITKQLVHSNVSAPARYPSEQRFSSNTSTDSTANNNQHRYAAASSRSISESRTTPLLYGPGGNVSGPSSSSLIGGSPAAIASNRNSMKDTNSNRSSMDVSTCSYNTLIIHPDDQLYASSMNGSRDYSSPSELGGVMNTSTASSSATTTTLGGKKDRPRSYGEQVSETKKQQFVVVASNGFVCSCFLFVLLSRYALIDVCPSRHERLLCVFCWTNSFA